MKKFFQVFKHNIIQPFTHSGVLGYYSLIFIILGSIISTIRLPQIIKDQLPSHERLWSFIAIIYLAALLITFIYTVITKKKRRTLKQNYILYYIIATIAGAIFYTVALIIEPSLYHDMIYTGNETANFIITIIITIPSMMIVSIPYTILPMTILAIISTLISANQDD